MKSGKLWGGRFSQKTHKAVEAFTASIDVDWVLYPYDIAGSTAHCRMLAKQHIIPQSDAKKIIRGLKSIERELQRGELELKREAEDIHMLIESRLIDKIGPVGGKLHTARSRNDQIALDINLYMRDAVIDIVRLLISVQSALIDMARSSTDIILPGFTHLQHAQPVLLAHHLMAYFEMLSRDCDRMQSCYTRINRLPLGAGALAGTPYPVDRSFVAGLLGYPEVTANSMDTVSDRDGLIELCSHAAIVMMHLSRLCEELIIWSSPEFAFVDIADAFCTGSSIMPQKKNPDVPELIRGKTGRVYGDLISLLTLMKSLPLTYNRDLQEDKPALFDAVNTTRESLHVLSLMLPELRFNRQRMLEAAGDGFLTATDLADYLAARGTPFRTAHEIVGRIVSFCIRSGRQLHELSLTELKKFSPGIEADALPRLDPETSVRSRSAAGATGKKPVAAALRKAGARIKKQSRFLESAKKLIP